MIAKLIPAYPYYSKRLGESTNNPKSYEDWEETFGQLIESELCINSGAVIDIFIYYKQDGNDTTGKDFIYSFEGSTTVNGGVVYVIQSNNDRNINGFDIIYDFLKLKLDCYDYIIYQEDDVILLKYLSTNYAKKSLKLLESKKVISYSVSVDDPIIHMGGLFSMFPINDLYKNLDTFPLEPQKDELLINKWLLNCLGVTKLNDIGILKDYNNVPINYELIPVFNSDYVKHKWITNKNFLFQVGKIK